jgi:hypothetical protein
MPMPAGKPGDHPVTDVVVHGSTVFGKPIDDLIRRLDGFGLWASATTWEWLYERYWDYRESQQRGDRHQVTLVLDHLEHQLNEEIGRLADDHPNSG